jgi:hypothetical protein
MHATPVIWKKIREGAACSRMKGKQLCAPTPSPQLFWEECTQDLKAAWHAGPNRRLDKLLEGIQNVRRGVSDPHVLGETIANLKSERATTHHH